MKILIFAGAAGAMQIVRTSYANALAHIGHQCLVWNKQSIFDVFYEFQPEILMCGSWELDRATRKCLLAHPEVKVILWGGNWSETYDKEIDYKTDPILRITEDEKNILPELIKNNNIQHVFTYYSQRWADITHDSWKEIGLTPIGIPLAADLTMYGPAYPTEEYRCDLSFVGGYWPYKATNINKWLLPLCFPMGMAPKIFDLRIKIFGYGNWPVPQHLGMIDTVALPTLFSSSCVNANIFEPLSAKYGFDVNERIYKILACGGFCLSEWCESAEKDIFTENQVQFAKTPEEFEELTRYYINKPDQRLPYIERGIESIKKRHNYFIRLKTIFDALGISDQNLDSVIQGLNNDKRDYLFAR